MAHIWHRLKNRPLSVETTQVSVVARDAFFDHCRYLEIPLKGVYLDPAA